MHYINPQKYSTNENFPFITKNLLNCDDTACADAISAYRGNVGREPTLGCPKSSEPSNNIPNLSLLQLTDIEPTVCTTAKNNPYLTRTHDVKINKNNNSLSNVTSSSSSLASVFSVPKFYNTNSTKSTILISQTKLKLGQFQTSIISQTKTTTGNATLPARTETACCGSRTSRHCNVARSDIALHLRAIILFIIFSCVVNESLAALFHGLDSSYLVYEKWNGLTVGELSFEMKTTEAESLLFYMDTNSSSNHYVMILIRDGKLSFEYLIGKEVQTETVGIVNDGFWHKVGNYPSFNLPKKHI